MTANRFEHLQRDNSDLLKPSIKLVHSH